MKNLFSLGFTLIEILIAVFIIGLLIAFITPLFMNSSNTQHLSKINQDIRVIESALKEYKLDNFSYPSTEESLTKLTPKYIKNLPKDPWGHTYLYISPGERSAVDIFTYGADGKKYGEGINADLGNWDAG